MKQITINCQGKDYTLEFTRATAAAFIQLGFSVSDIYERAPVAMIPFVHCAFKSKHPAMSKTKAEEIFDSIPSKEKPKFTAALVTMFTDTYTSLIGSDNGSAEGNATWEQNWDGE